MQEILLTSNNLELEMGDALIKSYENTLEYGEKLFFVLNLKKSVIHPPSTREFIRLKLKVFIRTCSQTLHFSKQ